MDVIFSSGNGVTDSLNSANAIITTQGGNRAHKRKCEHATPDKAAPTRNPAHMLAWTQARARWESSPPSPSTKGLRPVAEARWPPILLNVPVTKVRLTDSAPIFDKAGFIMPIAKLSIPILVFGLRTPHTSRETTIASRNAIVPKIKR
jgi:hypothetical protein